MTFKKKHDSNEENFWLSATDMMAGILVVVLLLMLLFLLYLNQSTDEEYTPLDETINTLSAESQAHENDYEYVPTQNPRHIPSERWDEENDEKIQNGDGKENPTTAPTEVRPEKHDGGTDERAAVFVTVVDADSGNTIKKRGIGFELYSSKNGTGGLQVLNSYYQEKIEYKVFETGDNGTFYLPEKISKGWYSLHNVAAPEGYYIDENTDFEIDEYWDWTEPYMVTVPMHPIKKTIRISAEDADTTKPVASVGYQVVASAEIKTADGTVRYSSGEIVDEIKTDDKGFAESKELYVGQYYLKQTSVPKYYAVDKTAVAVSVSDTTGIDTGLVETQCYKTSVTIRLTDERTEEPIKGAVYSLRGGGKEELITNENGEIKLTQLEKTNSYHVTSVSVPDGYIKKTREISFTVDSDGLVEEKIFPVIEDTAYTISLTVETKDKLFGRTTKGIDLQLLDEDLNIVDEWTVNDSKHVSTGLKPGKYFVQRAGSLGSRVSAYLEDKADIQTVEMRIWDTIDLFALLMGVGFVVIAALIVLFLMNRRKKVNRNNEK